MHTIGPRPCRRGLRRSGLSRVRYARISGAAHLTGNLRIYL